MIDFKIEDSGSETTLLINGELTVENAVALQGIFIRLLESSLNLTIQLQNVSDVDISFLQLLCSVHKTSTDLNKNLTLSGNCQGIFRNAVKDAGFLRNAGCGFECDKSCLWTDQEKEWN